MGNESSVLDASIGSTVVSDEHYAYGGSVKNVNSGLPLQSVPLLPEDAYHSQSDFPSNKYDVDGQQMDLRVESSWVQSVGQISTIEVMEVHAINALAPWVLISELRPVMGQTEGNKFIINVSAMEGQFYRYKTPHHPHTNMAKAALNMLTRTSAAQFAAES
eukprot:gene36221-44682_t